MKSIILTMLFTTSLTAKEQGAAVNVDTTRLSGFIRALRVSESALIQQGSEDPVYNTQSAVVKRAIKTRTGDCITAAPSSVCLPEGTAQAELILDALKQLPNMAADSAQNRANQIINIMRNTYSC